METEFTNESTLSATIDEMSSVTAKEIIAAASKEEIEQIFKYLLACHYFGVGGELEVSSFCMGKAIDSLIRIYKRDNVEGLVRAHFEALETAETQTKQ